MIELLHSSEHYKNTINQGYLCNEVDFIYHHFTLLCDLLGISPVVINYGKKDITIGKTILLPNSINRSQILFNLAYHMYMLWQKNHKQTFFSPRYSADRDAQAFARVYFLNKLYTDPIPYVDEIDDFIHTTKSISEFFHLPLYKYENLTDLEYKIINPEQILVENYPLYDPYFWSRNKEEKYLDLLTKISPVIDRCDNLSLKNYKEICSDLPDDVVDTVTNLFIHGHCNSVCVAETPENKYILSSNGRHRLYVAFKHHMKIIVMVVYRIVPLFK